MFIAGWSESNVNQKKHILFVEHGPFFNKVFQKWDSGSTDFSVNFAILLRNPILINTCQKGCFWLIQHPSKRWKKVTHYIHAVVLFWI